MNGQLNQEDEKNGSFQVEEHAQILAALLTAGTLSFTPTTKQILIPTRHHVLLHSLFIPNIVRDEVGEDQERIDADKDALEYADESRL